MPRSLDDRREIEERRRDLERAAVRFAETARPTNADRVLRDYYFAVICEIANGGMASGYRDLEELGRRAFTLADATKMHTLPPGQWSRHLHEAHAALLRPVREERT